MNDNDNDPEPSRPIIEWVFGAVSAAIVAAVIAFLGHGALFGEGKPPDLVATMERLEKVGDGTLVVVAVANRGDSAASDVGVRAIVTGAGEAAAREIRFDYIAARASRRGAFVIEGKDVGKDDLRLAIHGFVEP